MLKLNIHYLLNKSFNILKNNKKLILPLIASSFILFFVIYFIIVSYGFLPIIKEISNSSFTNYSSILYNDFIENSYQKENISYLLNSDYNESNEDIISSGELDTNINNNYMNLDNLNLGNNKNYSTRIIEILFNNFFEICFISLLTLLVISYLTCLFYSMVSDVVKKNQISKKIFHTTNHYFIKFLLINLIIFFIYSFSFILIIFIDSLFLLSGLASSNTFIEFLFIILNFIFISFLFLILKIFFYFSIPSLFLDNLGIFSSLKNSVIIVKKNLLDSLVVFTITSGILYLFSNLFSILFSYSFFYLILKPTNNLFMITLLLFLFILFSFLYYFILSFNSIFTFYSYESLKYETEKNTKNNMKEKYFKIKK